uniref:Cas scaffolding protein family member 4 n=1 Tax=Nannospalax galili TaxID=1026970 RepID=A0A8C6QXC4_NANGA
KRKQRLREGLYSLPQTLLARALYDNHPDCSDELAFSRGDILTIVEQNVPESEGWWKCLLHGREGLAPANRLHILKEVPTDRPCPLLPRGLDTDLNSSEVAYPAPTLLRPPRLDPVYEPMKSWVEGPPSATAQVYELPDPPSRARIICEKTVSLPRQALFVLPRPTRASLPTLLSQVYDVPIQGRVSTTLKKPEKQQVYDIPTSSPKAALRPSANQEQNVLETPTATFGRGGGYNTLPSPQKSERIYDTPVLLGKADIRHVSLTSFTKESGSSAVPGPISTMTLPPQPGNNAQKKNSLPEDLCYASLAPRDTSPPDTGGNYKVPSSLLMPRVEQQDTKPNIYDIPKATHSAPPAAKALGKAREAPENSSWISKQTVLPSPDPDGAFISGSDNRASMASSCSSTSTDSSSSSFSEDSAKELSLDVDLARETAMALQHKVSSSAAGLLLFVSRTWRFRDSLEANINAIRGAADSMEESLRQFLNFAQGVGGTACNLIDSHLQTRLRDQLQVISSSYQLLLDSKESLDHCNWSLEVLVTDKVQNSLDDLERFVLVARMIPEDVKRFASIVFANGRLLFKQNCERGETQSRREKCAQPSQREIESYQKSSLLSKQGVNEHACDLAKKARKNMCGQVSSGSRQYSRRLLLFPSISPSSLTSPPPNQQNPQRKIHLSEHCRLYFGALFKAIGVFASSLSDSQPPEVFITRSKLVITVGQKLVDTLCKETQDKDERNEILHSSSHLCGLLKDLALATKNAVIEYPSPAALGHLQAEVEKLQYHTREFRGMLE